MYQTTEKSLHQATQFISLCGINFGEKQEDDSHTAATWDHKNLMLIGKPLHINGETLTACLNIKEYKLTFKEVEANSARHHISLANKTVAEVISDIQNFTQREAKEWQQLHYQINGFNTETKLTWEVTQYLYDWILWRSLANAGLKKLSHYIGIESPTLVWPHHFDSGAHYTLEAGKKGIGAGLAIADSMIDEPYYYVYGYSDKEIHFDNAPFLDEGKWLVTEEWKGAVLPASVVYNAKMALPAVVKFFKDSLDYIKPQL